MGSPGKTRIMKNIIVTRISTIGMVNKMRVIKNLRNELDIISLSLNQDKPLGARFPSPPTIVILSVHSSDGQTCKVAQSDY